MNNLDAGYMNKLFICLTDLIEVQKSFAPSMVQEQGRMPYSLYKHKVDKEERTCGPIFDSLDKTNRATPKENDSNTQDKGKIYGQ